LKIPGFRFGSKSKNMKKIFVAGLAVLTISLVQAQQKAGKVAYERTSQMQVRMQGMNEEMERMIPRSRVDRFELIFGENRSLWKPAEQDEPETTDISGEGGGMQIRMVAPGSNDVLFTNFEASKRVEERELFDKKFIVEDSIRSLKWKMSEETKTILGHLCRKAIATNIGTRTMMNMDNGKMERKEVADTTNIIAWFTTDFAVPAGPAEYQGQLPGLILEMDINNGRQVFKATSISDKADLAIIKEPQGKKRYTPEEFRKEREKMFDQMQRNNHGGNRVIRMN
jgi:GLPGLI family protein